MFAVAIQLRLDQNTCPLVAEVTTLPTVLQIVCLDDLHFQFCFSLHFGSTKMELQDQVESISDVLDSSGSRCHKLILA